MTPISCPCGATLTTEKAAGEHAKVCRLLGMPRGWKPERGKA